MSTLIDRQIDKIEQFIDEKKHELDERNYKRYKPIFDIAFKFLEEKKNKVLFYGGFALNSVLPMNLRFYEKKTLPDVDVFSYDAQNLARSIVESYKKDKHIASFSKGLHDNTWKVMVDGVQVLDLTQVSKETFDRLARGGIKVRRGIKTVNRDFLRMALHMVLSQPNDARLWEKTIRRLVAFYEAYPPKRGDCFATKRNIDITSELIHYLLQFAKANGFVMFGIDIDRTESVTHLENKRLRGMIHLIVEQDPIEVVSAIKEAAGNHISVSGLFKSPHFGSYALLLDPISKNPWACIVQADTCLGYKDINGFRVASPHTIMRMYLGIVIDGIQEHFDVRSMTCAANLVSNSIVSSLKAGTHVKNDFTLTCYGPFDGIYTMRKKRYIKNVDITN